MRAPVTERIALMGLELVGLTEGETIETVLRALEEGRGGWICPVNLDVLRQTVADGELRALVSSADLVVADGMPLVWAARLQGTPLPGRVAGSTLLVTLSEALGRRGHSVYLLGGNEGAAQSAGALLQAQLPGFRLAGWCCPPIGFERAHDHLEGITMDLKAAAPNVVFVGLGFPKQDRLIAQLRSHLPETWFVSCGISFSLLIGEVRRAPVSLQVLGLEWTHRLMQEPERLAKRYLVYGLPFALRLALSAIYHRLASNHHSPAS